MYSLSHFAKFSFRCDQHDTVFLLSQITVLQQTVFLTSQNAALFFRKLQFSCFAKYCFSHFAKYSFACLGKAYLAIKLSNFPKIVATLACHKMKNIWTKITIFHMRLLSKPIANLSLIYLFLSSSSFNLKTTEKCLSTT